MIRAKFHVLAFAPALALLASCGGDGENTLTDEEVSAELEVVQIASDCAPIEFEGSSFTHCIADPERHRIRTAHASSRGEIYRSLPVYAASRSADAAPVAFAMNGGMFDSDGKPIGYYVEGGDRKKKLNRADGPGNFHMKPNGIFFGDNSGGWQVLDAESFYHNVMERPDFGTQSGPMLVVDGKLHPKISEDGDSKKLRNGVGVDKDGRAHFMISEEEVSFGKMARYFRDELATPNALFLDGSVSQLWDPATGRLSVGAQIGPLIVVENRAIAVP